jgi:hypothetical protein
MPVYLSRTFYFERGTTRDFHALLFYTPTLDGFVGGGALCKIDGEYGILTAWHVAEFFNKGHWYIYTVTGIGKVLPVLFDRLFYINGLDLSFIRFDPGFDIERLEKDFWDLEKSSNQFLAEPHK